MAVLYLLCFQLASSTLGFVLNSFLSLIIFVSKNEAIGHYKYLLLLYTSSSAVLGLCHVGTAATFVVSDNAWVFYDRLGILPYPLSFLFIFAYSILFLEVFLVLTASFIYRHLIVCHPTVLQNMNKKHVIAFGSPCLFVLILLSVTICTGAAPSDICVEQHGADFTKSTGRILSDAFFYFCVNLKSGDHLDMGGVPVVLIYAVCVWIAVAIIFYCAIRTGYTLKTSFESSESGKRVQWRIFTMLMLQLLVPMFFTSVPSTLIMSCAIFGYSVNGYERYFGTMYACTPLLEPIVIFIFMDTYRKKAKWLLFRRKIVPDGLSQTIHSNVL